MNLETLARAAGARQRVAGDDEDREITRIYAGDRMSDLLHHVAEDTLLVTHIANRGLVRLIELLDAPAICLLNGVEPDEEVIEAAEKCGSAILISPAEMYETCVRIHAAMDIKVTEE